MLGGIIHNYNLPPEKFQFLIAPLYATGSRQLNGLGRMSYHWYPGSKGMKAEAIIPDRVYVTMGIKPIGYRSTIS